METSNLLQFSAAQLSLLIDCIQLRIKDETTYIAIRQNISEEDTSPLLYKINSEAIAKCYNTLDELYQLRVAILNAWTIVHNREVINYN
jgi:hypothetical protein